MNRHIFAPLLTLSPFVVTRYVVPLLLLVILFAISTPRDAGANIFQLAVIDPQAPGFDDGDGDAIDAVVFFLGSSDGAVGNDGFIIDTVFVPTGGTIWIGTGAEEGGGTVTFRTDRGVFTAAVCGDNDGDGDDFDLDEDACNANGINSSRLVIPDAGNDLDGLPPDDPFQIGLVVAFHCTTNAGIAEVDIFQGGSMARIYVVCHGPLASANLSATETQLSMVPSSGLPSHSLIRLEMFGPDGGGVAARPITWLVDRCSIEVDDVDTPQEARNVLNGAIPVELTIGPDNNLQRDDTVSMLDNFDSDEQFESWSLAVVHCDEGHAFNLTAGLINVVAIIKDPSGEQFSLGITLSLAGPPAALFLFLDPRNPRCGEPAIIYAAVADGAGQPVADGFRVDIITNIRSPSGMAGFLGAATLFSGGTTVNGIVSLPLISGVPSPGPFSVAATAHTSPPLTVSASLSCIAVPTPVVPAPTPAPALIVSIVPPATGDAGLPR